MVAAAFHGHDCANVKTQNGTQADTDCTPLRDSVLPPVDRCCGALFAEYASALTALRPDDVAALLAYKIPFDAILTTLPVRARIALDGALYHPDDDGAEAWLLPVRVDDPWLPDEIETGWDVQLALTEGAIIDLIAFHPAAPGMWGPAARSGEPPWCDPSAMRPSSAGVDPPRCVGLAADRLPRPDAADR
jgi:hypothetical protein